MFEINRTEIEIKISRMRHVPQTGDVKTKHERNTEVQQQLKMDSRPNHIQGGQKTCPNLFCLPKYRLSSWRQMNSHIIN